MSRLEQLIDEFCPNGMEYTQLNTVLDYEQPTKYIVEDTNYDDRFETPVLTAGQSFVLGYTNETNDIYIASKENPTIIFDDFTTSFHWVNFNFKIKSSAMKMLRIKPEKREEVLLRYVYHCMRKIRYEPVDHSRQWIAKYSLFTIPLPHIEIQREIVRILDNFTELTAELTAELTDRKKQYEYYSSKLFLDTQAESFPMSELADFVYGYTDTAKDEGDTRFIRITDINEQGYLKEVDAKYIMMNEIAKKSLLHKGDLVMARTGATYGKTLYFNSDSPSVYASFLIRISPKSGKLISKYYWHFTKTPLYWEQANKFVTTGGQPQFNTPALKQIKIPIPYPNDIDKSLAEQQRIVDILDRFDTLCNDISKGLPAEIDERQKQYEYYRDKLLTFPKAELEV